MLLSASGAGTATKEYTPELEDEHFAHNCPDAPEQLRKPALARLAVDR
jgi:hypothetical protein